MLGLINGHVIGATGLDQVSHVLRYHGALQATFRSE
jgi:hypothetical protein